MDRINVLDRNLESVEEFDNLVGRNVIEVIKLTNGSYNAIASENDRELAMMNHEPKKSDVAVDENGKFESSSFELYNISSDSVSKTGNVKAIKETQSMIDNTDKKYSLVPSQISIDQSNTVASENVVEDGFDFYNINQDETSVDKYDVSNEVFNDSYEQSGSYEEIPEEVIVPEDSTLDNLVNSYEKVESDAKTEEDSISSNSKSVEKDEDNIIPQIKNFFMENDIDGVIDANNQDDKFEFNEQKDTQNLFEQISNEIDTASNISELSQKLNAIVSMNKQLTSTNEELTREKEAALDALSNVTEQQYEAEKRKAAADDKYRNMINLYQQKNEALEEKNSKEREEINEVKAKTEEVKTNVISLEKYSSGIIDMLSDYGYGSSEEGHRKVA